MMIAVIDYGAGNLFSVNNVLNFLGLDCVIANDKRTIDACGSIILPGVGAFPDAMQMLDAFGLTDFLKAQARIKPFLGICLGAQILFDVGFENVETAGLGLIEGQVRMINAPGLKLPHMGWNNLIQTRPSELLESASGGHAYFVHSYKIDTSDEYIAAYCDYGEKIPAVLQNGNIYGIQFHPEKSGRTGLNMLRNFGRLS